MHFFFARGFPYFETSAFSGEGITDMFHAFFSHIGNRNMTLKYKFTDESRNWCKFRYVIGNGAFYLAPSPSPRRGREQTSEDAVLCEKGPADQEWIQRLRPRHPQQEQPPVLNGQRGQCRVCMRAQLLLPH